MFITPLTQVTGAAQGAVLRCWLLQEAFCAVRRGGACVASPMYIQLRQIGGRCIGLSAVYSQHNGPNRKDEPPLVVRCQCAPARGPVAGPHPGVATSLATIYDMSNSYLYARASHTAERCA